MARGAAFALTGARVFDGAAIRAGLAVIIEGASIAAVVPEDQNSAPAMRLDGGLLAPGFIDIQVNGGGGALFNKPPAPATVRAIASAHRRHGVTGLLPTVITDAPDIMGQAIAAVREARGDTPGVLGIHVEGPFLDPARKGAHPGEHIRQCTEEDIGELSRHGCGTLLITIAPNKVPPDMVRKFADAGIVVSLGHADAAAAECHAALDAGASCFTHLFNAMSQMTGREGGMVGAALANAHAFFGLIADGHHVNDTAMKAALAAKPDHAILVSDAMPSAAGGPDRFELQGRPVTRTDGRLTLADGTLAGSDTTMDAALRYCVERLGVPLGQALNMAARNPARLLGRDDLGAIRPGALASLVHLGDDLRVRQTWIEGQ